MRAAAVAATVAALVVTGGLALCAARDGSAFGLYVSARLSFWFMVGIWRPAALRPRVLFDLEVYDVGGR
jgi:hypothetical protein